MMGPVLFFTGDHHFGHRNIIDYCGRPFTDVDRMREFFIRTWNEDVGPDDDVWYLGDFALSRVGEQLELLQRLNGHKVLVPGNHDAPFPAHRKHTAARRRYLDAGFDAILDEPMSLTIADHDVKISHFPYRGSGDHPNVRQDRYEQYRPVNEGGWLLHGHVHERWRVRGRQINCGVDAWSGHPVSLATIEYHITHPYPHDRTPWEWCWAANYTEAELDEWMTEHGVAEASSKFDW